VEIPIFLAARKGTSKLRTLRDGWRSLRLLLLYCPNKIFLWPGLCLFLFGLLVHFTVIAAPFLSNSRFLGNVTGIFATIFSVAGFQILSLGLYLKTYSWSRRFEQENKTLVFFYRRFKLETGLVIGAIVALVGAGVLLVLIIKWIENNFAPLLHPEWASFGATLLIIGINIIFTSLFISAMSMDKKSL
jgi:hypothetical protein